MSDLVLYSVSDPVAVIRLNKPERLNALDFGMLGALHEVVRQAEQDPSVVGIVITGTGRAFCSGWDAEALVDEVGDESPYRPLTDQDPTPNWFSFLLDTSKPVIVALNGVAAATGFVLALMADLRFAAPTAKLTTAFAKRGLVAEHGSSWLLPRLIGPSRALDLLFTSRMVEAEEALRIGLVDRIESDPVAAAEEYVRGLAETVSPAALCDAKRLVYRHLGDHDRAVREAWDAMTASFLRPDPTEGIASFVERRPPQFPRLTEPGGDQPTLPG